MEFVSVLHLTSMKQIIIITILIFSIQAMSQEVFCEDEWPQATFYDIDCRVELVSTKRSGNSICIMPVVIAGADGNSLAVESEKEAIDFSLLNNNMISSRKEFRPFADRIDLKLDWKREKITFYTNSVSYKHGQLDSDYLLVGVSISEDGKTLNLAYQSTFHGVCQGIRQLTEWYSYETTSYALVIPSTVEMITSTSRYLGPDCSEIP